MTVSTPITAGGFNNAAWNLALPVRSPLAADVVLPAHLSTTDVVIVNAPNAAYSIHNDATLTGTIRIAQAAATGAHLGVARTPEYIADLDERVESLTTAYGSNGTPAQREGLRQALVARDMATRSWARHVVDFRELSLPEQRAAHRLLYGAGAALEGLNLIERDPNNPRHLAEIAATGRAEDYLHAFFSGGPWGQESDHACCSSHPQFPDRVPHQGVWPAWCTADDVAAITRVETGPLCPFVRYQETGNGDRSMHWSPLNAMDARRPYLHVMSRAMALAAAESEIDRTLKDFIDQRSAELLDDTHAFPYFEGDTRWVKIQGALDVLWGPYEPYKAAFEVQAMTEGYVGVTDREMNAAGLAFQALIPIMEAGVVAALGAGYTPRDFSKGQPPLVFENAVGLGDSRRHYVAVAFNLPNVPPYGNKGCYRKVFLTNHQDARYAAIMAPMAALVMHPSQRDLTAADYGLHVVGHENAHGVGVNGFNEAKLAQPWLVALEEAKAEMEGVPSLLLAVERGIITREAADRAAIAKVHGLLRGLSYGTTDAHGTGAIIEFTELVWGGALVERDGYYWTDTTKIYAVSLTIARRIERLQLRSIADPSGATAEAAAWFARCRDAIPARMKNHFLPILERMPKDVFPWYEMRFDPQVEAQGHVRLPKRGSIFP